VDGKTVAQRIPSGPAVQQSKQQVAEYKRFRELARELIEISDQICDLRLKDLQGVREVETKKKRNRGKSAREDGAEDRRTVGSQGPGEIQLEAFETAVAPQALAAAARFPGAAFKREPS